MGDPIIYWCRRNAADVQRWEVLQSNQSASTTFTKDRKEHSNSQGRKKHELLRQAKATNKNSNHHMKDPGDRPNQLKNYQSIHNNSSNQGLEKADFSQGTHWIVKW